MLRRLVFAVLAATTLLGLAPAWAQEYQLVWQDEFVGNQLDPTRWEAQVGTGCPTLCGWGNNELQYYRAQNATVSGGMLTITAKLESFGGKNYTSARLRTKNLGDWNYGRIEMRAQMPIGQGIWPAFWMLPTDEAYGVWAASGEIDILEYLGHQPNRVFGTLHYGASYPGNQYTSNAFVSGTGNFSDGFHDFALEWEPCQFRWYVDGVLYASQSNWYSSGGPYPAPFDQRFHLLLNLAVGGNLPGSPNGSTVFPQRLVVDHVRVYQKPDYSACTRVFDSMDHGSPFANGWFSFGGTVGGGGIGGNTADLPPVDGCKASLNSGWGSGGVPGYFGGFGRGRPTDLIGMTHFTLWIHPDPGQHYRLEINLQEDDNGDNIIAGSPNGFDDEFQYSLVVGPAGSEVVSGGGWQRFTIPLSAFVDDNSFLYGGNGVLDASPVSAGGNGQLVNVVVAVVGLSGSDVTFRTDLWAFTRQVAVLEGRVWSDADADGVLDTEEAGSAGIGVELVDTARGTLIATRVTTADGRYRFDALLGATYEVRVVEATLPPGSMPTFDPDGVGSASRFTIDLACDASASERNFGFSVPILDAPLTPTSRSDLRIQPNPFRPRTVIEFGLAEAGQVRLAIYDVAGRPVRTLTASQLAAGPHRFEWDATDDHGRRVHGGTYYCRLQTPWGRQTKPMTVLR